MEVKAPMRAPAADRQPVRLAYRGLVQRKCACGGTPGPDGECAACRAKRLGLQRQAASRLAPSAAPASVQAVLRSPGQPLDPATRAFMEPRFGHDFSRVRVHTDAQAAASARAVNAVAYTVGRNVVFGSGQYTPGTHGGRQLLAHELAHVTQQAGAQEPAGGGALAVAPADDAWEREAESVAVQVLSGAPAGRVSQATPAIRRVAEPYISKVTVDLSPKQKTTLEWKGTPPASASGSDSFTVSTGKGYSDLGDDPGTCSRTCCGGADTQCAPPYDEPKKVGACCTPVGTTFYTGKPRPEHNGWKYWTPVEPVHTEYNRGIALHQHDTVTGEAIGHGCIRMEEVNAKRIYDFSRGRATNVTIQGKAKVSCPTDRQCGSTGATGQLETSGEGDNETLAALSNPDTENAGSESGAAESPAEASTEEAIA